MPDPLPDQPPGAVPLDRGTLIARFDGIRQFRQGGQRAPNKPLLLLYALARVGASGPVDAQQGLQGGLRPR